MPKIIDSSLGQAVEYKTQYDPTLLFPISRREGREGLGIDDSNLPFSGEDLWTGYEVSWLSGAGKPQVAIAEFRFPADSPNIIESKSFKLYLNSFNQSRFDSKDKVQRQMEMDLSALAGCQVKVSLLSNDSEFALWQRGDDWFCIDELEASHYVYQPDPELLHCDSETQVEERLYSHLLRSNCPVTGQPDWGTVFIEYRGAKIEHASLMQYVISFRTCQDFHEHCVERMFADLQNKCKPESLSVYARYTRRGGLDINPYRATPSFGLGRAPGYRLARQ